MQCQGLKRVIGIDQNNAHDGIPVIAGEGLKNRIGLLRQFVVVLGRLCRWSDRAGGVRSLFRLRPEQSDVSPAVSSVCSAR